MEGVNIWKEKKERSTRKAIEGKHERGKGQNGREIKE